MTDYTQPEQYKPSDWQQVTVDEARAWGNLVPDDWAVLVRHAYANEKRRQLASNQRRMLRWLFPTLYLSWLWCLSCSPSVKQSSCGGCCDD